MRHHDLVSHVVVSSDALPASVLPNSFDPLSSDAGVPVRSRRRRHSGAARRLRRVRRGRARSCCRADAGTRLHSYSDVAGSRMHAFGPGVPDRGQYTLPDRAEDALHADGAMFHQLWTGMSEPTADLHAHRPSVWSPSMHAIRYRLSHE